jgi:hypothetical protein
MNILNHLTRHASYLLNVSDPSGGLLNESDVTLIVYCGYCCGIYVT